MLVIASATGFISGVEFLDDVQRVIRVLGDDTLAIGILGVFVLRGGYAGALYHGLLLGG